MQATEYIQYRGQVNIRPIATAGVASTLSFQGFARARPRNDRVDSIAQLLNDLLSYGALALARKRVYLLCRARIP